MALVYQCDRCDKVFKKRPLPDVGIFTDVCRMGESRCDLCPECQQYLENWLNEFKEK